ncbi:hypothetical protein IC374_004258 [Salmonella enterica]|nr:hypothetical protein [Salmonella enterica]EGF7279961.1 hypothetical protein [Salmonella enterica]
MTTEVTVILTTGGDSAPAAVSEIEQPWWMALTKGCREQFYAVYPLEAFDKGWLKRSSCIP